GTGWRLILVIVLVPARKVPVDGEPAALETHGCDALELARGGTNLDTPSTEANDPAIRANGARLRSGSRSHGPVISRRRDDWIAVLIDPPAAECPVRSDGARVVFAGGNVFEAARRRSCLSIIVVTPAGDAAVGAANAASVQKPYRDFFEINCRWI